jgi:hypothetical protein
MDTFNVIVEDKRVLVKAELPPHDPKYTPRQQIKTHQVVSHLKNMGVSHGECIQDTELCNSNPNALSGTWIFERFEKKIEKTLDKSAEKVILPIEEVKPAPKKRKSRAKKKTSK